MAHGFLHTQTTKYWRHETDSYNWKRPNQTNEIRSSRLESNIRERWTSWEVTSAHVGVAKIKICFLTPWRFLQQEKFHKVVLYKAFENFIRGQTTARVCTRVCKTLLAALWHSSVGHLYFWGPLS